MPEHNAPMTKERMAERVRLAQTVGITLNDNPATISGLSSSFATVTDRKTGLSAQWSWESVKSIIENNHRRFYS